MASVVSKMGFVFVEQGFSTMFIPMCISISICCSGTGFFYQVLCPSLVFLHFLIVLSPYECVMHRHV